MDLGDLRWKSYQRARWLYPGPRADVFWVGLCAPQGSRLPLAELLLYSAVTGLPVERVKPRELKWAVSSSDDGYCTRDWAAMCEALARSDLEQKRTPVERAIARSKDGRYALRNEKDSIVENIVELYDTQERTVVGQYAEPRALEYVLSPSGKLIAATSYGAVAVYSQGGQELARWKREHTVGTDIPPWAELRFLREPDCVVVVSRFLVELFEPNGVRRVLLKVHEYRSHAFAPDGTLYLATLDAAYLFRFGEKPSMQKWEHPQPLVGRSVFLNDGRLVVQFDQRFGFLDLTTGALDDPSSGQHGLLTQLRCTPDGKHVVAHSQWSNEFVTWNVERNEQVSRFEATSQVQTFEVLPDGRSAIALTSGDPFARSWSVGDQSPLLLERWDLLQGEQLSCTPVQSASDPRATLKYPYSVLQLSPDGERAWLEIRKPPIAILWDISGARAVCDVSPIEEKSLPRGSRYLFSADATKALVIEKEALRILDALSGTTIETKPGTWTSEQLHALAQQPSTQVPGTAPEQTKRWSSKKTVYAETKGKRIQVSSVQTGMLFYFDVHLEHLELTCIDVSPDGTRFFFGFDRGLIHVIDRPRS